MKLRFTTMAVIVCVAAVALNVAMGVTYSQRQTERSSALTELAFAEEALAEYQGNATGLQQQSEVAAARLAEEQRAFEDAMAAVDRAYSAGAASSAGILDSILKLAGNSAVSVIEVSTRPEGDTDVGDLVYSALHVDMRVAGSLADLGSFVSQLESGAIKGVTLGRIAIAQSGALHVAAIACSVLYPRR
jgi:hypothetical protein